MRRLETKGLTSGDGQVVVDANPKRGVLTKMAARGAELNKDSGVSRRQLIQAIAVSGISLGTPTLLGASSKLGAVRPFDGTGQPRAAEVKAQIAARRSFRVLGSHLELLPLPSGTVAMRRSSAP